MDTTLEKYGLKQDDITKVVQIMLILIDQPKNLKTFYNQLSQGYSIQVLK